MKILAVVVTHNRCALLSRCLDYLHRQSRLPDTILVVNNGSTDETEEMLRGRGITFITQDNAGSAGGWHRGIQFAVDHGFDAVWLMDDDGYPDVFALEYLEAAVVPGVSCMSSVVLRENQPTHFVFPFPRLNNNGWPIIFSHKRKYPTLKDLEPHSPDGLYPFAHLFNGALVSISSVGQAGNVDKTLYLSGEEVDYFCRLKRVGSVFSLLTAHHFHPDVTKRPFTPPKFYYYLKNIIILNGRYFDHVFVRNICTILIVLCRTASRNGWLEALSYLVGGKRQILYSAIVRGLSGKVGNDFHG